MIVPMRDKLRFLGTFLRHPLQVSSIIPTTHANARRIVGKITKPGRKVVVEYGPGSGVVAKELLRSGKLTKDSKLILIDNTEQFVRALRREIRDPRVHAVHDSAENVEKILQSFGEKRADYVLSSIPLLIFPKTLRRNIVTATRRVLGKEGTFIVFLFRSRVRKHFEKEFHIAPMERLRWNFPPLVLFVMKGR